MMYRTLKLVLTLWVFLFDITTSTTYRCDDDLCPYPVNMEYSGYTYQQHYQRNQMSYQQYQQLLQYQEYQRYLQSLQRQQHTYGYYPNQPSVAKPQVITENFAFNIRCQPGYVHIRGKCRQLIGQVTDIEM